MRELSSILMCIHGVVVTFASTLSWQSYQDLLIPCMIYDIVLMIGYEYDIQWPTAVDKWTWW